MRVGMIGLMLVMCGSAVAQGAASARPTVVAHRGWLAKDQVENSLPQIAKTVAAGVPWIEMDLGTSKDGTLYLLHDRTLDRTTDAKGPIRGKSDAELADVELRSGEFMSREPIPSFRTFLLQMKTTKVHVMVDLKDGDPAQAAAMLRDAGMIGRVVFLSFDPATDVKAFAADPKVLVSVLVKSNADVDAALLRAGKHPLALYVPHDAPAALFAYAAKTGKPVITDAMETLDVDAGAKGERVYVDFLRAHPVSLLVTNRPLEVMKDLAK